MGPEVRAVAVETAVRWPCDSNGVQTPAKLFGRFYRAQAGSLMKFVYRSFRGSERFERTGTEPSRGSHQKVQNGAGRLRCAIDGLQGRDPHET